jgi:gamma-glutamylcyclotransferase (GGCT)/AIG2-like uncharacterized protein YtfP
VYWHVDEADMARLDAFEGSDYERVDVEMVTAQGETKAVALYLYRLPERLLDAPWDPELFLKEGMARFIARYAGFKEGR